MAEEAAAAAQAAAEGAERAAKRGGLKTSIPQFTGEGASAEDISVAFENWLSAFEDYLTVQEITDDAKLSVVRSCFKAGCVADKWFGLESRRPSKQMLTWDDCKRLMTVRFLITKTPMQLAEYRERLKQGEKEPVRDFGDRCLGYQIEKDNLRINKPAGTLTNAQVLQAVRAFSDDDSAELLLTGMKPWLRKAVARANDTARMSFSDLVQAAFRIETSETDDKKKKGDETECQILSVGASNRDGSRNSQRGGRGGGRGGGSRFPPTDRPRWVSLRDLPSEMCFTCGNMGHTTPVCRVPQGKQAWDETIRRLGLQKPPDWQDRSPNKAGGAFLRFRPQQQPQQRQPQLQQMQPVQQQAVQQQPVVPQPGGQQLQAPAAFTGFPGAPLPAPFPQVPPQHQTGMQGISFDHLQGSFQDFE